MAGNIALAENVGDMMPEFLGRWATNSLSGNGVTVSFHPYVDEKGEIIDKDNYEYAFAVSTREGCGLIMTPFVAFSYAKKELYVDFDGDGIIDFKYNLPNVEAGEKIIKKISPDCYELEKGKKKRA